MTRAFAATRTARAKKEVGLSGGAVNTPQLLMLSGIGDRDELTRLGIPVTLLQKGPRILPRDEPVLVDMLVDSLRKEGVDLRFNVETEKVTVEGGDVYLS